MTLVRSLIVAGVLAGTALAVAPGFAADGLNPQTQKNLEAAMHGEAFANLKYQALVRRTPAPWRLRTRHLTPARGTGGGHEH